MILHGIMKCRLIPPIGLVHFFPLFNHTLFQNATLELTEARCSTAKQQYEDHKGIDNYAAILGVKVVMEATSVDWQK